MDFTGIRTDGEKIMVTFVGIIYIFGEGIKYDVCYTYEQVRQHLKISMANQWGILKETKEYVIKRDLACVYCGVNFSIEHESRKTKPTWEHIVNDIRINSIDNISLCCTSCNASKGAKLLEDWLKSTYCSFKGITKETIAQVIKNAIENPPKLNLKE